MALFSYLANKYYKRVQIKKLRAIEEASPYRRNKPQPLKPKGDNYLAKDKIAEKRKEEEREVNVTKYDVEREKEPEQGTQIVGIAPAIGFWTKFVRNQKMGFMLALMNLQKTSKDGYFVNIINAQARSQGKEQGRGRS